MTRAFEHQAGRATGDEGVGLMVRVLGPTRVEHDGEAVSIGGRRQRAVLARLVLAEGNLVTVDRLVDDVWGDDAPAKVVSTLQGYLSLLRRALGDGAVLRREGPGYVLDLDPDQVDARRFERLAREAGQRAPHDPVAALPILEDALGLWRGFPYADIDDAEWARAAAVRLDELRLAALEVRFDALLGLGRHAAALTELERAVDEHPLRERFVAQLLVALYRSGRQADALRTFDRTRARLVDELGIDPSPELIRLQGAILAHDPSLAAPERVGEPPPARASGAPSATTAQEVGADAEQSPVRLPAAAVRQQGRPFVGRDSELDELRAAWREALGGSRRMVVVTGEAGAGKTRLTARFAEEAHSQGAIVLWGRATTEAIIPYEPIVEALRTVLRSVSPDAQRRVVEGRDALALLIPDLAELVPGVEIVRPEIGAERYFLFETVAELLEAESAVWPILFVVDDLHAADELSLRLLTHLLRHERPGRVLVIGTVRTLPASPSIALDAMLADLHRDGMLVRLALGGLDGEEVQALLDATGWSGDAPAADAILRATSGNPFFVSELAAHGADSAELPLPESIREVLGGRLDQLDDRTGRLVAVAAVAGPVVAFPVLAEACGLPGEDALDAIDLAIAQGILTEDGPAGSVTFAHALVRQAALERLSHSRRRALHLDVVGALRHAGDPMPAELAHHLLEAGPLAPADEAVTAAVAAGRDALAVLAYEDADRWAERALERAGSAVPAALRAEALLLRSDSRRALGRRDDARAAATDAAEAARAAGAPVLLARAAEALAVARAGLGFDFGTVDEDLDALLDEALQALPAGETAHRARLLGASVSNAAAEGDRTTVDRLSEVVLRLAETDDHPALAATARLARRMSSWRLGMLDARLADDRAALDAARRAHSTPLEMNALLYGITDLYEAGLVDEAAAWLDRFRRRAADIRQPVYDAFVLFLDATQLLIQGDYDTSARLCDEAVVLGRQSHGPNAEQTWAGHAFIRAWDRGELAGLLDLVAGAHEVAGMPIWTLAHAACSIAAGRPDDARRTLEVFVGPDGVALDDNSLWLSGTSLLVEIARSLGDVERSKVLRSALDPYVGRMVVSGLGRASLGPVSRFAATAAMVAGDAADADRLFRMAEDQCRRLRARPHLARALHDHAAVLRLRGDTEAADHLAAEASALAADVGVVLGPLAPRPR